MSNIFNKYQKELAGVEIIDSSKAYVFNPKTGKKDLPNPKYNFVGKIDINMPNFVIKMNKQNCKTNFIEDVSALPKRLKKEIVNHFYNDKGKRNLKSKAYLIRTDTSKPKGSGVVK